MRWVFSAVGGQGSHYLIDRLRSRYTVGDKPDNSLWRTLDGVDQSLDVGDQGEFKHRSGGFDVQEGESLETVFPRYLEWLRSDDGRTAVFGLSAEFGLFSRFAVRDVVFLFRDPVDAYVSWAKPARHGAIIDQLGGIQAPAAIEYYQLRWRNAAAEYVLLRGAGLEPRRIRYESARADAAALGLDWAFDTFADGRTNRGHLPESLESQIRRDLSQEMQDVFDG